MSAALPSAISSSFEARLAAVEAKLGVLPLIRPSSKATIDDVSSRLDAIKSAVETHTTSQFRDTWQESEKLFQELNPGMALTHQQQPLLYRRQEILASADALRTDMEELRKILHLLLTSQPAISGPLREDHVTQAPIITQLSISYEDERRLDALRLTLQDLQNRTQKLMRKMDQTLECYHTIMTAASEKIVLADETILMKEARQF